MHALYVTLDIVHYLDGDILPPARVAYVVFMGALAVLGTLREGGILLTADGAGFWLGPPVRTNLGALVVYFRLDVRGTLARGSGRHD